MELTYRDYIARSIDFAIEGLEPFVAAVITPLIPVGTTWVELLAAKEAAGSGREREYSPTDLAAILKVMTERLGNLGYPFNDHLSRSGKNLASELRTIRNDWAHNNPFTDDDTWRALDTVERLLREAGANTQADAVRELRNQLRPPVSPLVTAAVPRGDSGSATEVVELDGENGLPPAPVEVPASPRPTVTIALDTVPVLSYAVAHNRLPVINSVTITNDGEARQGAVLRIQATSALGVLGRAYEQLLDLSAADTITVSNVPLLLDAAEMLLVEERRPATISAVVEHKGEVLGSTRTEVDLLAAHQWLRRPENLAMELLAAFVQPNHPEITVLLHEATLLLAEATGSGSMEGYQSEDVDDGRVDDIAESIFRAMQNRGINYANPPASWTDDGQKVRTPTEVLVGQVGTCLDTAVVMAAAFEQAGLNPLIWITTGHAFVGYWRKDGFQAPAATADVISMINRVDLGLIALVETTLVTDTSATFATARAQPISTSLQGLTGEILGVTDVIAARKSSIVPLPARTVNTDGTVTVTTYQAAATVDREYEEYEKLARENPERAAVPYRVAQWKNSLLDLSLRNRLINFTDSARLGISVPASDVSHLEDLVNDSKAITLLASDELPAVVRQRGLTYGRDLPEADRTSLLRDKRETYASDLTGAAYTTRLRALAYKAKTIEEETGANNLYLAFGTLVWESKDRALRSPLILVPVKLEAARGGRYRIVVDESGTSTPNYCLLEKLKQSDGLTIPGLSEPAEDASGIDLDAAFQAARVAIANAGLPYRVEPTVDLAILQFAKFRLWKDLDENWEELAHNPLVRHLIESPKEPFIDPAAQAPLADLDELGALSPVPADSSQLAAIAAAIADQTFVLEGPPGTGKSQTITNLLVRSIAEGKKVLFVAEKRAALEVVQRRLAEVGLGAFTLDLHDKGSRPVAVRAQIKDALNHRVTNDPDGVRTTRQTLDGSRRSLSRYASRLHDTNAAGLSLYSARTRLLASDEHVPVMAVPEQLVADGTMQERAEQLRSLFRLLPDVADAARPAPRHPWALVDTSNGHTLDQAALVAALAHLDGLVADLPTVGALASVIDVMPTPALLATVAGTAASPLMRLDTVDAAQQPQWKPASLAALDGLDALLDLFRSAFAGISPEIVTLDLVALHAGAIAADESSIFGRKKRRLAVRAQLSAYVPQELLPRPRTLSDFTLSLVELSQRVSALREAFAAVPGLARPVDWNPLTEADSSTLRKLAEWIGWLGVALAAEGRLEPFTGALRHYFSQRTAPEPGVQSVVTAVQGAFSAVDILLQPGPGAIDRWANDVPVVPQWRSTAPGRDVASSGRNALALWVELIDYVEPLRANGLDDARLDILAGRLAPEMASASFEKGLAVTSLSERAAATTLDTFDSAAHEAAVARFTESSEQLRQLLVTDIPSALLSTRTFDVGGTGGQIGELKRQLDRQRGGLGVRALLDKFGPLIADLVPCMLMSPESVARFFGAKRDLFDIVVFDEASQVRVADAIGAMGRGRSVVIVGDSKQMPPTSFAETTIAADDDVDRADAQYVQDEESILTECTNSLVPSLALTWHYRSQDESLISFSNEHYYGNLSSFPSPLHGTRNSGVSGHGISLVRVDGTFLRAGKGKELRTNPVEATAIVDEIKRRFATSPDSFPSLGVVTFNAQQRALIESLLRDAGDTRIVDALDNSSDGLFVKNLENVQGDERDSILFSTAFSANERGVLPLNFGPVSQAGGERRLNVAITRARRQVILFSSFDPGDLRAEDTSSVGLKHLKQYLELASTGRSTSAARFGDTTVDRHREELAQVLRERGLAVTTDVGLSDFKIDLSVARMDSPDQPLVAVLLDNKPWADRRTVADRDGLPTSVLSNLMKWPAVSRVWLPDWLAHREAVIERLLAATEQAHENVTLSQLTLEADEVEAVVHPVEVVHSAPSAMPPIRSAPVQEAAAPAADNDEIFSPWKVELRGRVSTLDRLPARDARAEVGSVIRHIVESEGPINIVRLAKLTAAAFDLTRVNQARLDSIVKCIPSDLKVAGDRFYVWKAGTDVASWRRFRRTPGGVDRDIEHVHPLEVVNAMAAISVRSAGLFEDELRRSTLNFFGVSRMTPKAIAVLDVALAQGLAGGRLEKTAGGLITKGV